MARKRRTASDVQPDAPDAGSAARNPDAATNPDAAMSPAEQHALQRSAPLSTADFKAIGELVERGDLPLRRLFRRYRPR